MHDDAEKRMLDFMQGLNRPRSVASRIQEMLPVIEEARTRGARWPEIADVLGIPRSTLLAAYARARKRTGSRKSTQKVATSTAEPAVQPVDPTAPEPITKVAKARKVDRWSG